MNNIESRVSLLVIQDLSKIPRNTIVVVFWNSETFCL